ncbi:hypothetical protein G6Y96_13420 [Clostridium perfringens]|uniref:hypothetical protein n=1 Tax=Clostridium perfringens TaxID=1502 RepID=UPI0013E2F19F|nr:hypothetical protein [Clostridium perfringens]NGT12743.1 hypothetical protein [Clostridium perfringens]
MNIINNSEVEVFFLDSEELKKRKKIVAILSVIIVVFIIKNDKIFNNFNAEKDISTKIVCSIAIIIAIIVMSKCIYLVISKIMYPYKDLIVIGRYSEEKELIQFGLLYHKKNESIDLRKLDSLNDTEKKYVEIRLNEILDEIKNCFYFSLKSSITSIVTTILSFFVGIYFKIFSKDLDDKSLEYILNFGLSIISLLVFLQILSFYLGYRERKKYCFLNEIISKMN